MIPSPEGTRLIGWNGLQFILPLSWEVIVSGPCHLLIECDFTPVLEIRWHMASSSSPEGIFESTRRHLASSTGDVKKIAVPKHYLPLAKQHKLTAVSWGDSTHPDGLIWQCELTNTVIFCHLFHHKKAQSKELISLLVSLQCHAIDLALHPWSIQDFQLQLPAGFNYIDSTFKAGLSRLAFTNDTLNLQFCRLAPATTRLASSSLPQLLNTLVGNVEIDETLSDTKDLYEGRNNPSMSRQLIARLRKQRPFRWGQIWHDAPNNRLLSLLAESKQPIPLETVHNLCKHYEIIPFIEKN